MTTETLKNSTLSSILLGKSSRWIVLLSIWNRHMPNSRHSTRDQWFQLESWRTSGLQRIGQIAMRKSMRPPVKWARFKTNSSLSSAGQKFPRLIHPLPVASLNCKINQWWTLGSVPILRWLLSSCLLRLSKSLRNKSQRRYRESSKSMMTPWKCFGTRMINNLEKTHLRKNTHNSSWSRCFNFSNSFKRLKLKSYRKEILRNTSPCSAQGDPAA